MQNMAEKAYLAKETANKILQIAKILQILWGTEIKVQMCTVKEAQMVKEYF